MAIEDIRDRIDGLQVADEVADAVRKEIERHHMFGFTLVQKALGAVMGTVLMGAACVQIATSLGWF